MKNSLQIGSIRGIKVSVHWTFLFLITWIIFQNLRAGMNTVAILWSVAFILSIFVCVVLHELGHALMAQQFKIKTRDITLYPIGGVARLESMPKKPVEELLVALAGPAVNFVIAAVLFPFLNLGLFEDPENLSKISENNFLMAIASINVWLAIFNLIPAFPMDGGRVFRAILSFKMNRTKATRVAAVLGQSFAILFVAAGFYLNPFLIFIGIFIFLGAQAEYTLAQTEELMEGHSVMSIAMRDIPSLSIESTVGEAATEILNSQRKNFLIQSNGNVVGTLGQIEIIKALREKSENTGVGDIMNRNILYLKDTLSADKAIMEMQRESKSLAIVMKGEELVGMVDSDNLAEFILIQGARKQFSSSNH